MSDSSNTETSPKRRSLTMDPEKRRVMIVAAALPLVVEYGTSVTTAKIAAAAGIGEGTIFRVFPNKNAVITACLVEAIRPDDTVAHLNEISLGQPLNARLIESIDVLRSYLARVNTVASALRAADQQEPPPTPTEETTRRNRFPHRETSASAIRAALASIFEPDQNTLRLTPEKLADSFQLLLMFTGHTGATDPLTPEELVDLFLHGAQIPSSDI